MIINFISTHWPDISIVLAVLLVLLIVWKKGNKAFVANFIYNLVCEAEKQYGSKTGSIKKAAVIGWIYERLPWVVRAFLTQKQLEKLIDDGVEKLKEALKKPGANLLGHDEEYLLQAGDDQQTAAEKAGALDTADKTDP